MRENKVMTAWHQGQQTVGGWLSIDSAMTAEQMAHVGFDWLCLDMQHGMIDFKAVTHMLPAISTTETIPFVRAPWNEPYEIMRVLDAGAYGVIVPMVNNREEAERAVSACRYPPDGLRSFGPTRAMMYAGKGYVEEANSQLACIVMIETREALDHLDDILSTPGVDAAYIGPADLAYALGLSPTGDNDHPLHVETVSHILERCQHHKVAAGIHTGSLAFTQRYLQQGFQMVTLGQDSAFMTRLARQELKAARSTPESDDAPKGQFY
jgi:4-hydroxy-2-oxoheptanedioate aldolase